MADDERNTMRNDLDEAVNTTRPRSSRRARYGNSKSVGQGAENGESTGHESGRMIVAIKHKTNDKLTADDYGQMTRVVSYVHRQPRATAQRRRDGNAAAVFADELRSRPREVTRRDRRAEALPAPCPRVHDGFGHRRWAMAAIGPGLTRA